MSPWSPGDWPCPTDFCPSLHRLTLPQAEPCLAMDQDYERRLLRQIVIQNENTMPRVSAPSPPTTVAPPPPAASALASSLGRSRCC